MQHFQHHKQIILKFNSIYRVYGKFSYKSNRVLVSKKNAQCCRQNYYSILDYNLNKQTHGFTNKYNIFSTILHLLDFIKCRIFMKIQNIFLWTTREVDRNRSKERYKHKYSYWMSYTLYKQNEAKWNETDRNWIRHVNTAIDLCLKPQW